MSRSVFYFASKSGNLKFIKPLSQISYWPHVVHNLNLYYPVTGKKWESEDLESEYLLTPIIRFKKNRIPDGIPFLYSGLIKGREMIVDKDYPYLFQNKFNLKVEKMDVTQHSILINLSESLEESFFDICGKKK